MMRLVHSHTVRPGNRSAELATLLSTVRPGQLEEWVVSVAVPRHYTAEPERNRATADWITQRFESLGYAPQRQGSFGNIVVAPTVGAEKVVLVGAHYDSVPMSPGADDNASALAALLGCAAVCARWPRPLPVSFVAFNREEDHLMGSRDFVASYLPSAPFRVTCAHILEMVGFSSSLPGSQRVPTGLPLDLGTTGDFLGLLANGQSGSAMDLALRAGRTHVPQLTVTGLEVELGLEKLLPVLGRSDHVPFWEQKIPAMMWTDTAEFRNPHYHRETDTPSTLDYGFLQCVTQLLAATVIAQATERSDA